MRFKSYTFTLVAAMSLLVHAQPEVTFSGFLDADVVADFDGNFYANQELDVGMSLAFAENVSANLYVTMLLGRVPAGTDPVRGDRWVSVLFDGFDITFDTKIGTFSVGDLVYQYGGFNYYYYKRLSMITPESFTRGIQYSLGTEMFTQMLLVGVTDSPEELIPVDVGGVIIDTVETDVNELDLFGASGLTLADGQSVEAYYGVRFDVQEGFSEAGAVLTGLEYNGLFGDALSLKADVGYQNLPNGDERANVVTILVEPVLTLDKFSLAASFYTLVDPDSINEPGSDDALFGLDDELFFYIEPGYAFTEMIAAGLPLEYHEAAIYEADDITGEEYEDASIWVVPTLYVYPADGVQWWLWGGATIPVSDTDIDGEDTEVSFSVGSEIIVEF
ncbi:MAG: hypothetical protein ACLFSB_00355 [Chitinispirillaceae bacterium]